VTLPLIVLGAGGHSRVLLDALQLIGSTILGVVDPALKAGESGPLGYAVLGGDDVLERYRPDEVRLVNGIGSIGPTTRRDEIYRRNLAKGFGFASVVHPSAVISTSAVLAEGVQIMAGCVVQTGASIGANTIVNTRASVDHDCRIGETVHVAPGVTLSGTVTVGDRTHIGTGATVIQGITIGPDSVIAAGAAVYRDLPACSRFVRHSRETA
jgi:UDP-perosamine 4-acetyltransferase